MKSNKELLDRIKNSGVGRVYRSTIGKHRVVRKWQKLIWRKVVIPAFQAYKLYTNKLSEEYELVKLSEYVEQKKRKAHVLAAAESLSVPAPRFSPIEKSPFFSERLFRHPEIYVSSIDDAIVLGNTGLIFTKGNVIHHDLLDLEKDCVPEEEYGIFKIKNKRKLRIQRLQRNIPEIERAASFVDAIAYNYAHWLTEVLPRIAVFCSDAKYNDIPIIVNRGLHTNIWESIRQITGPGREIIELKESKCLAIKTLYMTSVAGYAQYEPRTTTQDGAPTAYFSSESMRIIREKMSSKNENLEPGKYPEKIYLKRRSDNRVITNINVVDETLKKLDFSIIYPEELSFTDQVKIFSNAKMIVGPTGAAFANLVFANQEAKIIILIMQHKRTNYWYWQHMAYTVGNQVSYVLGRHESVFEGDVHADYYVDADVLEKHINLN